MDDIESYVLSFDSFGDQVVHTFAVFVRNTVLPPQEHQCLADYIYSWAKSDLGARTCQRNFVSLQIAAQIIAHWWHMYPGATDYRPFDGSVEVVRRVVRVFRLDNQLDIRHPIHDPNIFK